MEITYLGHSSFQIKTKTASLVTDPFEPKMVGLKYPRVSADIVTISHAHADHNQANLVVGVRKVISAPGEYEISGISLTGIASYHDDQAGKLRGKNVIFIIEAEGLRLAHLGDLGHSLSEKTLEEMGEIDILFIPVGGEYTLGPKEASEVVSSIEPTLVIPMHFQVPGLNPATFAKLAPVEKFLTQLGMKVERQAKLKVTRDTLQPERVILLTRK